MMRLAVISAWCLSAACWADSSGYPPPTQLPVAHARPGECIARFQDGVASGEPDWLSANQDLDGDGVDEAVRADLRLCDRQGNCHWNLFAQDSIKRCSQVYWGTVSGAHLQRTTDASFSPIIGWWRLSADRWLRQTYTFSGTQYEAADVVVCRRMPHDYVQCGDSAGLLPQALSLLD